jgi:hypothetical protein
MMAERRRIFHRGKETPQSKEEIPNLDAFCNCDRDKEVCGKVHTKVELKNGAGTVQFFAYYPYEAGSAIGAVRKNILAHELKNSSIFSATPIDEERYGEHYTFRCRVQIYGTQGSPSELTNYNMDFFVVMSASNLPYVITDKLPLDLDPKAMEHIKVALGELVRYYTTKVEPSYYRYLRDEIVLPPEPVATSG